jgi:hypothetical protein
MRLAGPSPAASRSAAAVSPSSTPTVPRSPTRSAGHAAAADISAQSSPAIVVPGVEDEQDQPEPVRLVLDDDAREPELGGERRERAQRCRRVALQRGMERCRVLARRGHSGRVVGGVEQAAAVRVPGIVPAPSDPPGTLRRLT